ncbi:MAG: hypothetical protein JJU01_07400 [Alkalibacterium sp.]|nr:hypothetical protein [Alkalibacterium sp.]TVP89642.1 MAG: hypothetical protein EA249_09180 [Alkalibacterium sp.]
MKKIVSIIVIVLGIFSLLVLFSACTDESASTADSTLTISEGDLTEREEFLLSSLTEQSFMYDFAIEGGHEGLALYVEKFVYGEQEEYPVGSIIIEEIDESGSLLFAINRPDIESDERSFIFGVESDGNWSTVTSMDRMTIEEDELAATLSESAASDGNDMTVTEGTVILASIIHANGEKGISTLTHEFYEDVEGNLDEIEAYETVYLLTVEFFHDGDLD